MATSNGKGSVPYVTTESQKEFCAILGMRDAVAALAKKEQISYENALLRFASSRAYDALFNFDTEIWKEGSNYLLYLYYYLQNPKKTAN